MKNYILNIAIIKHLVKKGYIVVIVVVVFFLLIPPAILIIFSFKIIPSKAFKKAFIEAPYDAIIVPGVPFDGESMSKIMKARVLWACHLYKSGVTKNIIFSGSAVYTPYIEAEIMAEYAKYLGIPENKIYIENKAEHSTENVYYSIKLAEKLGFNKVALATDPFQALILRAFIKNHELNIKNVPIVFDVIDTIEFYSPTINFDSFLVKNFISLPDRENQWERFKGTFGGEIK